MRTPSPRTRPLVGALAFTIVLLAGCAAPPAAPPAAGPAASATLRLGPTEVERARTRLGLLATGTPARAATTAAKAPAITSKTIPATARGTAHPYFGEVGPSFYSPVDATVYQLPALAGVDAVALGGPARFILYVDGPELGIFDTVTQLARILPTIDATRIFDFDVDAYGNVTYIDDIGRVHVFDTATDQDYIVPAAGRGIGWLDQVAIAPGGGALVVTGRSAAGPEVVVSDLVGGAQYSFPFLDPYVANPRSFELSADGRTLLYDEVGQLRALDTATGYVDNLAGLNAFPYGTPAVLGDLAAGAVMNATFLDGYPGQIVFERAGRVMTYDRATNLVDTMPILNHEIQSTLGVLRARDELYHDRLYP